jgi:DnaJ-class molecular chaperone
MNTGASTDTDYYRLLGITHDATLEEMRHAMDTGSAQSIQRTF